LFKKKIRKIASKNGLSCQHFIDWRILKSFLPVNDGDTWGPVPKVFVTVYRFENMFDRVGTSGSKSV